MVKNLQLCALALQLCALDLQFLKPKNWTHFKKPAPMDWLESFQMIDYCIMYDHIWKGMINRESLDGKRLEDVKVFVFCCINMCLTT
jgi:hypothetical protein